MTVQELITGGLLVLALLVFGFYATLAVRHAARFRYLSTRTIYMTLFFVALSAALIAGCLIAYSTILFS